MKVIPLVVAIVFAAQCAQAQEIDHSKMHHGPAVDHTKMDMAPMPMTGCTAPIR